MDRTDGYPLFTFFPHHPQGFNIVWAFFFFEWLIYPFVYVCVCVCLFVLLFFYELFFSDWSIDRFECCERVGTKTHKSYSHQYIYCPSNSRFYIQFSQQCFTHTQTHNQYRPYTFSISYFLLICFYTIFNDIYTFNGIHAAGHQRDSLSYFLLFLLFHTWLFANKKTNMALALLEIFFTPSHSIKNISSSHTWNVKSRHKFLGIESECLVSFNSKCHISGLDGDQWIFKK